MKDTRTRRWHKTGLKYLAFGTAAATTLAGVALGITASNADQPTPQPTGPSAAHSHFLYVPGLGLDVAGAALANSEHPSNTGPNQESLNAALLNGLVDLQLGSLTLPLLTDGSAPGLLNLGSNVGAVQSYAASPSDYESLSASGAVTDQGSIDLDLVAGAPGYSPAYLDLTALFSQLNITGLTDQLLDGAKIELGVLASQADKTNGAVNREYALADLQAELSAPILAEVTGSVDQVVGAAGTSIDALLGPTGSLTGTVKTLAEAISISIPNPVPLAPPIAELTTEMDSFEIDTSQLVTTVRTELLNTPINNATATAPASIEVDLANGLVSVDLEQLLIGPGGPYAGLGLDGLPANTDLLEAQTVEAIASGLVNALTGSPATYPNALTANITRIVTDGLYSLEIGLDLSFEAKLLGIPLLGVSASLLDVDGDAATLGGLLDQPGYKAVEMNLQGSGLGALLNPLLGLLGGLVTDLTGAVGAALSPIINTAVTNVAPTVVSLLDPLLEGLLGNDGALLKQVLNAVATITINAQSEGDLGPDSYTVRALDVKVLPGVLGSAAVGVELASSTVQAANPVATLTATPSTVAEGEPVTLAGTFFAPGEAVTFTVDGATWVPVPAVTTDTDGAFGGVVWTVPAGYSAGDTVEFIATDALGNDSTATVTIVEPTLSATDAQQGGTVNVTGGGFVPGEEVTISLPGGGTATVTAGSDGTISYNWPVSATQDPVEVTFTATGESGRAASADANISLAVATLTASPNPVEPGGTVTLIGGNFAPNENVTIVYPAECVSAGPNPVIASSDGILSVTCDVEASTPDGAVLDFTATGVGSGRTATTSIDVNSNPGGDVNANASASAAASAQANGDNQIAAQAAAEAAAMADNSSASEAAANAAADSTPAAQAAAQSAALTNASTTASATATATTNAAAQASAQSSADSTGTNASTDAAATAAANIDARAASQASASAAADGVDASANASQDATANVRADANASASASASARANGDEAAAAQAAAQAAAYSVGDSDASASATVDASAAAEAAAYTAVDADVSSTASADVTTSANAAAQAASQASTTASTQAQASADHNADSAADGSFDSRSAARSAAEASSAADAHTAGSADAAVNAAANVQANANASASASASADADNHSNPAAQAAALAAAMANNTTQATAAADVQATAAAQAAARPDADTGATSDASQNAGSSAEAAARSTADVDAAVAQNADSTTAADVNAEASAAAAAQATASADASQNAAADVNASASAAASAQADSNANAAAQAAAETSAMANASTIATAQASAAATANAEAAAQAAAEIAARADVRTDASTTASQDTSVQANAAANVAAHASADHTSDVNADATAAASASVTANASSAAEAAARQAANVDSTATASATAAASATAQANATPASQASSQGSATASGGQKLVNTGATVGGFTAAALLLLLVGSILFVGTQRRKSIIQ